MSTIRNRPSSPVSTAPVLREAKREEASPQKQSAPTDSASAKSMGHDSKSSFKSPGSAVAGAVIGAITGLLHPSAPSSRGEALQRADSVLNPAVSDSHFAGDHVVHDGRSEQEAGMLPNLRARGQVQANAALEHAELAKLPEEQQHQYHEVKDAIGKSPDGAMDQLALQKMLFEGKLPGKDDSMGKGSTLDYLAQAARGDNLAQQDASGHALNKNEFAGSLTRELATPSSICQGQRGTCAPTSQAIELARSNPAEYARIATGLASKDGKVQMAGGGELQRDPGTSFADDGTNRSVTQRIMAPALMEAANGSRNYNDGTGEGAGANAQDLDALDDRLFGQNMQYLGAHISDSMSPEQRAQAKRQFLTQANSIINHQLAQGNDIGVGMIYGSGSHSGGHEVLITGATPNGDVQFINPWGDTEQMSAREFADRMFSLNYQGPDTSSPALSSPSSGGGDLSKLF